MGRKGRVRVAGPLAAFAEEFGAELERLAYSRFTVEAQLQLMAHVSGWLEERGLGAGELTAARVEQYLVYRRACGHVHRCSPRALAPLLAYLRGLGVAPPATPALALTAPDRLLKEYEEYLFCDRGLAARTIEGYRRVARLFLASRCSLADDALGLGRLTTADVSAFMLEQSACRGIGSLGNMITGLAWPRGPGCGRVASVRGVASSAVDWGRAREDTPLDLHLSTRRRRIWPGSLRARTSRPAPARSFARAPPRLRSVRTTTAAT